MSESKPKKPSVQADRPNQAGQQEQSNCGNQADQLSSSHVQALPSHTALNLSRQNGSFARAPYNFVPLLNQVVPAQAIPDHDRYQGNTGWIDCELEALTPLYVRGMMKATTFAAYSDTDWAFSDLPQPVQREMARFFNIHERLVIPGSSLRGMIRMLIEIITFGKVGPVTDKRIVFRAVGDPTSLGQFYRSKVLGRNKANAPHNHFDYPSKMLKGGYLRHRDGQWYIQPAVEHSGESFIHVEYSDAKRLGIIQGIHRTYQVFVKPAARQTLNRGRRGKGDLILDVAVVKSNGVSRKQTSPDMVEAALVVSGHMGGKHSKHWHCAIYAPDDKAKLIPIPEQLWKLYEEDRDMKRGLPTRKLMQDGDPLFYLLDEHGELIFFGPTQMFRLPYDKGILEFIPYHLRKESTTDMAEAMFGYVKSEQMPYGKSRAYAGRVFFSDALALPGQDKLMSDDIITPQILSSPKPSTFQHYLVQPDEAARDRAELRHYASDTVIRGHKLYWHRKVVEPKDYTYQGSQEDIEQHKKQLTGIQPVRPGARFAFRVYFENLTDEELGALLWALELPAGCAHKLGMGKPLGLGSARVKVTSLRLTDRLERYRTLFSNDQWSDGAHENADISTFKRYFEKYILDQIAQDDLQNAKSIAEIPRIRELLCLLSFENAPPVTETRYMTIKPTNEYAERPVLPLPSTVLSSNRNLANLPGVSSQTTLRPAAAQPESKQKPSVLSSSQTTQQTVVATLLTVPNNRSARIRLASGIELDCSGFSPMAQNKPGSQCRVRLITDPNGQPLSAEFAEWLQS